MHIYPWQSDPPIEHNIISFFCQLTAVSVIALVNSIAEAVSDNRELKRVFHQIISSNFRVIASDHLDISTPHEYAYICYGVRKPVA